MPGVARECARGFERGQVGYVLCTTVVEGYNFLHALRVSVWMKFWEESACPLFSAVSCLAGTGYH